MSVALRERRRRGVLPDASQMITVPDKIENNCSVTMPQTRPDPTRPDQTRLGQARPGQARPGQTRPGQARPAASDDQI